MKLNRNTIASGPKQRLPVPPAFDSFKLLERREEFHQIIKRSRHSYGDAMASCAVWSCRSDSSGGGAEKRGVLETNGTVAACTDYVVLLRKNCL
jgi:hypothetical protein